MNVFSLSDLVSNFNLVNNEVLLYEAVPKRAAQPNPKTKSFLDPDLKNPYIPPKPVSAHIDNVMWSFAIFGVDLIGTKGQAQSGLFFGAWIPTNQIPSDSHLDTIQNAIGLSSDSLQ